MGAVNLSDPQSLNFYAYCGNDPINKIDPDGLDGDGASSGNIINIFIHAVIDAIHAIFGGGGARTGMVGQVSQRFVPIENNSEGTWVLPSILPGVGGVNFFMGKKRRIKIIRRTPPPRPRIKITLPPELELPKRPPLEPRVGFPDNRIPEGQRTPETYKLPDNATRGQKVKFTAWQIVRVIGNIVKGGVVIIKINPEVYCEFGQFAWCPPKESL